MFWAFSRDEVMWDEVGYFQGSLSWKVMELQSHSKHRNHFDVNFKQTCSEKNLSDFHGYVFIRVETFFFVFDGNMKWRFVDQKRFKL
jgi:hypothetical protein